MTDYTDVLNTPQENIEEHLEYAEKLVYKYDWDLSDRLDFESRLFQIKTKQADKCLNLSVVGEFGTGKSTLINAFLRSDEFLVSSALQGTTVAATVVENYHEYGILLEHMNSQQEYKTFESSDSLREGLIAFTTDPQIARNLYNVKIRMPCEHLSTGFRIIDTPGLNANEKWHEKVTLRTIEEMSDMSVLIIDANKPLTNSFCEFIKQTLSDMLDKCIFLVTRIDMIRKRERQGVLDFLKVKIEKEFSLNNPIVLPYASTAVLDALTGGPSELSEMSYETESVLFNFMRDKKESALKEKLKQLINDMYFSLAEKLRFLSEASKDELWILLQSQQIDLEPFVTEQIALHTVTFKEKAAAMQPSIVDNLQKYADDCLQNVITEIDKQGSVKALQAFIEKQLAHFCEEQTKNLIEESGKECLTVQTLFTEEILSFHAEFQAQFKDMDILKVDICCELFDNMAFPSLDYSNLQSTSNSLAQSISKSKKVPIGSTAAGAAIGSAIAPGLGTIIGGAIGLLAFSPKLGKLKEKTKEELSEPLKAYFNDIVTTLIPAVDAYISELEKSIEEEINKYLYTYNETIAERIRLEKENIAKTQEKILEIQKDMEYVTLQNQKLNPQRKDD